jgi:two-component system nitrogen regulation response regulator NtrX
VAQRVLIVDDEPSILRLVADILVDEGFATSTAAGGAQAMREIESEPPDLVLLDVAMPGDDGLAVLEAVQAKWPDLPVVMMSGHGTVETAVRATRLGAWDFLEKPLSYDKLLLCVRHVLETTRLARENLRLREDLRGASEIIGETEVMRELKEQIGVAGPTEGWVLITGENGTGKELVARQLHLRSKRDSGPFVEVNSAAIPDELIESELFGHEKGAFTGAVQTKRGRFEVADGGTIFLDEIGDMSLMTQSKILRILQEHRFERVGANQTIEVNVRVIAATNKDLELEMAEGRFREDLYYRLNVIPFRVPALQERAGDIPLLVDRFLDRYCADNAVARKTVSADALERMLAYPWPGNVRELQNVVERLVLMTASERIEVSALPQQIASAELGKRPSMQSDKLSDARALFEREFLTEKLRENGGNISRTAEVIGLKRESLSRKLRSLGIDVERAKDAG